MAFTYENHTADVKFVASAPTLQEAFSEAARAVTHVMTEEEITDKLSFPVSLRAESKEALLFDFLSEVIVLLDTESLFVERAALNITRTGDAWVLSGTIYGDLASKYDRHGDVKAPTYHDLSVVQEDGKWVLSAVLDI